MFQIKFINIYLYLKKLLNIDKRKKYKVIKRKDGSSNAINLYKKIKMDKKDLWILTEERPKREVIHNILYKFITDSNISCFIDTIRILPILNDDWTFSFTYKVIWFTSETIWNIFIETVSWKSSFVDFLLFFQNERPKENDTPLYAIEETKTDDWESRNTGVFQRASKFVYIDFFYPDVKKIMLYSLQVKEKENQTDTNIFWTKCLYTLGIEVLWKENIDENLTSFSNIDEVIKFKNWMRRPPKWNVPILINKYDDRIEVSWRLWKAGSLSHDPNIWALSLIASTLRILWWTKKIVLTEHWLEQKHIKWNNKFIQIASKLNLEFKWLNSSVPIEKKEYWNYDLEWEKLWTIFLHIVTEYFTNSNSLFENHAGCEKSYFLTKEWNHIPLQKYIEQEKWAELYKVKVAIPDLILIDFNNSEILNLEWKKYKFKENWIKELDDFDAIEDIYIKPNYPDYKILRSVVLYWSTETEILEIEVSFLLNKNWNIILWIQAPKLFKEAIKNLLDYWNK